MLNPTPLNDYLVVKKFDQLHCMIDLETLGTEPGCPILSIGAVFWVPSYDILVHKFYIEINLSSYDLKEWPISASTLKWWLQQSPEAQAILRNNSPHDLKSALEKYNEAVIAAEQEWERIAALGELEYKPGLVAIWANGPTFDIAMMKYASAKLKVPFQGWTYRNERCFRTFLDYCPVQVDMDKLRQGVYHNALDDAITQVKSVMTAYFIYRYQRNELPKSLEGLVGRAFSKPL